MIAQALHRAGPRLLERAGRAHARLPRPAPDEELARVTIGLQVGARDDAVAHEERERVVAEPALRLRLVDLDDVVEAQDAARERAVPQQVLERRQEDARA